MSLLLLTLLAATDAPRLLSAADVTVDLEAAHFEVRRLDAQLVALPRGMPVAYPVGAGALFSAGLGMVPFASFLSFVMSSGMGPAPVGGVLFLVGVWMLVPVGIILGIAVIVAGVNYMAQVAEQKKELTRRRDAALVGVGFSG
jgi:hypothetical protein